MSEARRRFAQYAVLRAISSSARLRELLVSKGGDALDFVWSPNRGTIDLDFSADMRVGGRPLLTKLAWKACCHTGELSSSSKYV